MLSQPLTSAGYKQRVDRAIFFGVATNPAFSYNVDGTLAQITYNSNGATKIMTYADGYLTQIDSTLRGVSMRKTFNYNGEGLLTSINEVQI